MLFLNRLLTFFCPADKVLAHKVSALGLSGVAVYGAGELGIAVVTLLEKRGVHVLHWYDSSVSDGVHQLMGYAVTSPGQIPQDKPAAIVVASEAYAQEISRSCRERGFTGQLIRVDR